MAANVKHIAAQIPKLTLFSKTNRRLFGKFEREIP